MWEADKITGSAIEDEDFSPVGKGELQERQPNPTDTGAEHWGRAGSGAGKAGGTTSATPG